MCSYLVDPADDLGEIAFTVAKDHRNEGLTTFMLAYLVRIARERGLKGFKGDIIWENQAMVHIIRNAGYTIHGERREDGDFVFSFTFDKRA